MRQRRVKNLDEKLKSVSKYIIEEPKKYKGRWNEVFGNDAPIYLELGCGKGNFLLGYAAKYEDRNYIGIEGQMSVIFRAVEKAAAIFDKEETNAEKYNVRFVSEFVRDITDYFEEGELAGIYLNFSDPWPKARHAKRRLTYGKHLAAYSTRLRDGGMIEIKTDNDGLFEFTMEQIEEEGFEIAEYSRDLHASGLEARMITTEYEEKFKALSKNIYYVKIKKK